MSDTASPGAEGGVPGRNRAFAWIAVSYVVAIAAAGLAVRLWPPGLLDAHPLALVAAGDLAGTVVIFAFSVAFRNSSFYDAYWSVAPMVIAPYLWLAFGGEAEGGVLARRILVTLAVWAWGARLTYNWARGWTGLGHEDWRYVDLRAQTGALFPLVNFSGIMLFPTILVYLGCLGLYPALVTGDRPLGILDAVAAVVAFGATVVQGVADNQLRAFRKSRPPKDRVMDVGLWSWSRHPNYFGEISIWVGVALFGVAAGGFDPYLLLGPGAMIALFVGISIPMMEKRQVAKRPAYAAYQRRTSFLIPWPPRRT